MINRNQANYTNFDKTNKRIVQAPGGSTSLSLGWGHNEPQKQRSYDRPSYQQPEQSYSGNNQYGKKETNVTSKVGGEYGYNSYNTQQGGSNTSKQGYQQQQQQQYSQQQDYSQQQRYQQPDPVSYYQPSSSSSKKLQNQLDYALQQQKHKIQSSRGNRANQSNSSYQSQPTQQTRPCVKIHQQKNNHIFGEQYDYCTQQSSGKQQQFLYEKQVGQQQQQPQQYAKKGGEMYNGKYSANSSDKTSVKVHNPPGGKSNFTFG